VRSKNGLTPEEDAELRRLHWFESNGFELSDERRGLKEVMRERDRRAAVRVPHQVERVFDEVPVTPEAPPEDATA
jgi:hypothetical protein